MSYPVPCAFCGESVDAESKGTWHQMVGWARPGAAGGSDVALRRQRSDLPLDAMFAHDHCIRREQQRIPALQEAML